MKTYIKASLNNDYYDDIINQDSHYVRYPFKISTLEPQISLLQ